MSTSGGITLKSRRNIVSAFARILAGFTAFLIVPAFSDSQILAAAGSPEFGALPLDTLLRCLSPISARRIQFQLEINDAKRCYRYNKTHRRTEG
jgi:hypothetical protein